MTERDLRVFDDLDGLVAAAVEVFVAERPRTVALSGGSTPKPVYERLATIDYPWPEVDVFFGDELRALTDGDRLHLDIVYTRTAPPGFASAPGRLTAESLRAAVLPADKEPRVFVCGPTPFVEAVAGWLIDAGHAPARVRTERFGGS